MLPSPLVRIAYWRFGNWASKVLLSVAKVIGKAFFSAWRGYGFEPSRLAFHILWLSGSSTFVWANTKFVRSQIEWRTQMIPFGADYVAATGWTIVVLGLVFTHLVVSYARRHSREATFVFCVLMLAPPLGLYVVWSGAINLRAVYTASFLTLCLGLYASVSFPISNVPEGAEKRELRHRRYLLNVWFWIAGSFTVGYLAWELSAYKLLLAGWEAASKNGVGVKPELVHNYYSSHPYDLNFQWRWVFGFLQLALTVGMGALCVLYAFHQKLKEVEDHRLP